jgi:uncharacterized protein YprB with RNaseH-like and TPR domain
MDIETCPEWVVPGQPGVPDRFLRVAEDKMRAKAPARWRGIDEMRLSAATPNVEQARELAEVAVVAEDIAFDDALTPLRGRVVAVGLQQAGDLDRVFFTAPGADDEKGLLVDVAMWLDARRATHIATYNGSKFDMPFFQFRMLKHRMPRLPVNWRDLSFEMPCMRTYTGAPLIPKLSELVEALGMAPMDDLKGDAAPRLVRDGRLGEVLEHLACDMERLEYLDLTLGRPA